MKKILKFVVFIIFVTLILPSINVYAAGSISISTNSINIEPGKTKSITVKASNAAGRIEITSSNNSIVKTSITSSWIENGEIIINITAINEGTAIVNINLTDVATYDGEELTGSKVVNVNVKRKEADKTDSYLSSLNIEGYKIEFNKNILSYNLDVPNNVTKLNITALSSSSAASVKIKGNENFKVGKNKIVVLVTAGNLTTKEYIINVNRKEDMVETTQDQLSSIIKNVTNETIMLKVTTDTLINESIINEINKYNKNLIINKYDNKNKIIYSWNINKTDLKNLHNFDVGINFDSSEIDDLKRYTNYSEGFYIKLNQQGEKFGKLKVNVSSLYKDNIKVHIYSFDENELKLIQQDKVITDSFIEFDLSNFDNYIITRANLIGENQIVINCSDDFDSINVYFIISIIETVIICALLIFILVKFYFKKNVGKFEKI